MGPRPDWHQRLFKLTVGLGSGPDAVTLETVIDGPEYLGPYLSADDDLRRTTWQYEQFTSALAARFPNEKIKIVKAIPAAKRQRPPWDRP